MVYKKKVTLILSTWNRPAYLRRALDYYKNADLRIVICDSSQKKFTDKIKYPHVSYHFFKNESLFRKLVLIKKQVKTPYVVMCAEDDFILPETIHACVDFLEKNNDYASAQGYSISFSEDCTTFPIYLNFIGASITGSTGARRLEQQYQPFKHQLYDVMRTSVYKNIFDKDSKHLRNLSLTEQLVAMIASIRGKHKILPLFYTAREFMVTSAGLVVKPFKQFVRTQPKDYSYFVTKVAKVLAKQDKLSLTDAKKQVRKVVTNYLCDLDQAEQRAGSKILRFFDNILPSISKIVRNFLIVYVNGQILKQKVSATKGFPFGDKKAKLQWERMYDMIKKHDVKQQPLPRRVSSYDK